MPRVLQVFQEEPLPNMTLEFSDLDAFRRNTYLTIGPFPLPTVLLLLTLIPNV